MHKFIDNIISFSLKNRFFIFFLTAIAVVAGAVSFMHTSVDAFPDVSNTKVTVITQWPGRSAEEVEKFVGITLQAEKEVLAIVASNKERNAPFHDAVRAFGSEHCFRRPGG